jgi:hypothetical protein
MNRKGGNARAANFSRQEPGGQGREGELVNSYLFEEFTEKRGLPTWQALEEQTNRIAVEQRRATAETGAVFVEEPETLKPLYLQRCQHLHPEIADPGNSAKLTT